MENGHSAIDSGKRTAINQLIIALGTLLSRLLAASRATADDTILVQINNEYAAVQTILNQATQAQVATNDILFGQMTEQLKAQADSLQGMEEQIKKIVADVALAGKITGYIAEAIGYIGKL